MREMTFDTYSEAAEQARYEREKGYKVSGPEKLYGSFEDMRRGGKPSGYIIRVDDTDYDSMTPEERFMGVADRTILKGKRGELEVD